MHAMTRLATLVLVLGLGGRAMGDGHPDFTGTWKIDLAASETPEEMLKAQGLSWVERQAAKSMAVTQTIRQAGDKITILVASSLRTKEQAVRIGGPWEEREGEMAGKVKTRTLWSADGKALVTETEMKLKDGTPAEAKLVRTLEDGGRTMVQRIELRTRDGRSWVARRVFRRAA